MGNRLEGPPNLKLQWIPGPMAAGFAGRLVRMATMHLATRLNMWGDFEVLGVFRGVQTRAMDESAP